MAMVLDAFASYVAHMLTQVTADEVGTMLGVSGEIDKLGDKLRDLKNFLADADRRNITDETVQEWVGQLKRAMYEATDILDLCQLKAIERGSSSTVDAGCFNPLLFCMRNPSHAHEIGARIKALNKRLDSIKERSIAFNFINLGSYEDRHSSNAHASRHGNTSRETTGDFDRLAVVGEKIEEDTRALVAQIMQTSEEVSNNNIMVVAIVGVGGIGKTTLAQKVFNDETIQGEFSKKIWLSVNQNFSEVELLRRAIIEAGGDAQPAGNAKATLNRTLKEALIGHKTLLVMDDVWNHGAWEGVLKIPLVNVVAAGSRVLITTRDVGVARGMTAAWPYHHVDILAPGDAWSLLKKQVLSTEIEEDHINILKDIGFRIIEKCGGLPLAIKVMGGLLRQRGGLRSHWEQVLDDSKWSITKMPQELNYAVHLSYEDMPPYLKQCFIYYSLLPKRKMFSMHEVIALWISEGFVHGSSNDIEACGRKYYDELISRNLIEPDQRYLNQIYCSMHDVVRSFAQYMSRDEALVAHDEGIDILKKLNSQKFLRLSIDTNQLQSGALDWKSLQEQKSVRTLLSTVTIKMEPDDSLVTFSSLRSLHIESADVATLVKTLHQLKHLRYLTLVNNDISVLPGNIGKMKLLQFFHLHGCEKLVNLPDSIVTLGQLRLLSLPKSCMIPRGFCGLTNMRKLTGFQAHMDGDWCSLDELGPLSQLRLLNLNQLENVSAASFSANARLVEKINLNELSLCCTSLLGHDRLIKEKESVSEEEQQRIKKVFDALWPPPNVELIRIDGYFGQQLPSWMMSRSRAPLNNLKFLIFEDLACCIQLPSGLCQLPYLQFLRVNRAPCIRCIGTGFLQAVGAPFPRLNKLILVGMVEWEAWEWEVQVQAMPRLERIEINNCKLSRFPPGLVSSARALKHLILQHVQHLRYIENFPSVVEITVHASPHLKRITNLPNLQQLNITSCPKLMVLESIPALERLVLTDTVMEKLPDYIRHVNPRLFILVCRLGLLASVAMGESGLEWDKFRHVEDVKAYAFDGNVGGKWYLLYTRSDNKLDTNIRRSTVFEETLSSSMVDTQGFESIYKMRRSTFSYICSLVRLPFLEDMMARDHTFVDGRVMSLQDRVATALRMLNSGEPPEVVGSSLGVNQFTITLVTRRFIEAIREQALHPLEWPYSFLRMENIKCHFDKIHGLPNCCGVVHTAYFGFGSPNLDHEENADTLMQAVVDADMKFTHIWFGLSCSMNQSSILHDSALFKLCENGAWLNGSKLKLSDGSDVGEYIIGDAGYPLRPWLLTPYQLEDDISDSKVEFNSRHSAATAMTLKALERLKDMWKCLQGEGWHPNNQRDLWLTITTCCRLHNIVIDMEAGAGMLVDQEENYIEQVNQLSDEDAVKVRDVLSQHLIESGVHTLAAEEEQEASGRRDENKEQEAHQRQTTDRGKLYTNNRLTAQENETLSSSMVGTQGFESLYKMRRSTFSYICSLVKVPLSEDMMVRRHTFVDDRVLSFHDGVAIALRMLNSGETPEVVGSSFGVDGSTVSLLTQRFVKAMEGRATHHISLPGSTQVEKIKCTFDKIHGLPNCCGVVHTGHIKFGSKNHENEEIDGMLMQAVVDPDMRFTGIIFRSQVSMNQSSMLHDSYLFEYCEKGTWLNGSKLKVSSGGGSEVKEYIIGDAGYPLRPWLLTPYQLENGLSLSGTKAEFNRKHSAATAVAERAVARLKDTWKCLEGKGWCPNNQLEAYCTVDTCCILHNIVIDMEEDKEEEENEENYIKQVRRLADEDAVRVRDALSQYLIQCGGNLPFSMVDAQGFESVYKMRRSTFSYVCSLVRIPFLEDMIARNHAFVDGRVLSLQDGVAIALRMLNSGESPVTVGSFLGVKESTASLVTQSFVKAMYERALRHLCWSYSSQKMEKIKRKFDKINGLPNCCGVVHTTHIKFGSQNRDDEVNDGILMQAVLDPDMRFRFIHMRLSGSRTNGTRLLRNSELFKHCEKGTWLNGSKLKISSGGGLAVREYIIGSAGYPLRPWLLTPYQLENGLSLSDSKVEFNRRHSAARAVTLRALARLKGTWKCLQGEGWRPNNELEAYWTVDTCCMLHNIVIDMEEDGVGMPGDHEYNRIKLVWHVADEEGARARDILSQHLIASVVHTMAAKEEQEALVDASGPGDENNEEAAVVAASSSGDKNKEQEVHRPQPADRGKEKVHGS